MALPFVPVANTVYASLRFSQPDGSFASQGFWVKRAGVWTPTEMLALAAVLKTWWLNGDGVQKPCAFMTASYSLVEIVVRDYTTLGGSVVTYNTGLPSPGLHSAVDDLPMGVAFALTLRTGLAGRSNRGRTFCMGLNKTLLSNESNNLVSAAAASEMVTAYDAMIPAIVAGDATEELVVASRHWNGGVSHGPTLSRVAGITTPVISFGNSNLLLDFQRSRAPGH
jgi:hypothetical protein